MEAVYNTIAQTIFPRLRKEFYSDFLITLFLVDAQGRMRSHKKDGTDVTCHACGHDTNANCARCEEENASALKESLRFGETYIMNSYTGLVFIALPVMMNQELLGGIISTRILPIELRKENAATGEEYDVLLPSHETAKRYKRRVPSVDAATLRLACDALYKRAKALSLVNDVLFAVRRKEHEKEANIAEALHSSKLKHENYTLLYFFKEQDLIQKIKAGDKRGAVAILNEMLVGVFNISNMSFEILKARVMELIVIISRAAVEAGVPGRVLFGLNYTYFRDIARINDYFSLTSWIVNVLENYIDKVGEMREGSKSDRIEKALAYVAQHLNERISLATIASHLGISETHFSHEFKRETGVSFTEYVNDMKIRKGAEELLTTDKSVVEISYDLGFTDQSYFIRRFKKKFHTTPLVYRKKYERRKGR